MSKIKKKVKIYKPQRLYDETVKKLQTLSRKRGLYMVEIIKELVDKNFELHCK